MCKTLLVNESVTIGKGVELNSLTIKGNNMTIDQSTLTKGQVRKLNALRKSVGDDIAEDAFGKWIKTQPKALRKSVTLLQMHWSPHSRTSKTTRVSSWVIRDTSCVVRRVREC